MFKRKFISITLLVILILFKESKLMAQAEERAFDQDKIERLRKSSDYQYESRITFSIFEWLERISQMVNDWLRRIIDFDVFSIPEDVNLTEWILLIAAIIALIGLLYIIFKGKWSWLFSGRRFKKKAEKEYLVFSEDIHSIPFESEIEKAITQKDYRKATRLFYLKSLKELTDHGHIQWTIHKTNLDYKMEISSESIRNEFDYLSIVFEYIWYGEIQPKEELFFETFAKFREFSNRFPKHTSQL